MKLHLVLSSFSKVLRMIKYASTNKNFAMIKKPSVKSLGWISRGVGGWIIRNDWGDDLLYLMGPLV